MQLVLNTYGTSLSKDNEGFVIISKCNQQRLPVHCVQSILITRGASITSDAVELAVQNEIEILFVNNSGNPYARIWSPKYGSVSTIRKGQLIFSFSKDAVKWIKGIIAKKIENQQALLMMFQSLEQDLNVQRERAANRLEDYRNKVLNLDGDIVSDVASKLRGWEGIASKIYFDAVNIFLPEKYRFENRSQHPATDVANAMLNYGYGLLYGKIEGMLIKAGIDPYIGVLHRDDYNRPVLVYDVIEIYRVWVDFVVFNLLSQDVISEEYYSVREDGSFWLEGLGRRILIQSLNDYMDELITIKGISRSRQTQIQYFASSLADKFKKYENA